MIFLVLIFLLSPVFAVDTVISPPDEHGSGCDLSVTDITDVTRFKTFFDDLQQGAKNTDKEKLAKMVAYPISLKVKKKKLKIKDAKDMVAHFDIVFDAKILETIQKQAYNKLFCNSNGVMFGDGEIWISSITDQKTKSDSIKVYGIQDLQFVK